MPRHYGLQRTRRGSGEGVLPMLPGRRDAGCLVSPSPALALLSCLAHCPWPIPNQTSLPPPLCQLLQLKHACRQELAPRIPPQLLFQEAETISLWMDRNPGIEQGWRKILLLDSFSQPISNASIEIKCSSRQGQSEVSWSSPWTLTHRG